MKTHRLKIEAGFADDVLSGIKTFEIRLNDRGYQSGDLIEFQVTRGAGGWIIDHDLNRKLFKITYILSGFDVKEGWVVFSIIPQGGQNE